MLYDAGSNFGAVALSYPPIVIDDSLWKKRGGKLYRCPNPNPRGVQKCNSAKQCTLCYPKINVFDWLIAKSLFDQFGKPEIDLFASCLNTKCFKYASKKPDPDAYQVNAFSLCWLNLLSCTSLASSTLPTILNLVSLEECWPKLHRIGQQPWW